MYDLHPFFNVELVEAKSRDTAFGRSLADGLNEFLYGREVRKFVRIVDEVPQGDQRVGLAAAIGQLQLPHCFVVLAGEPQNNVAHELAQIVGGKGKREKSSPVFRRSAACLAAS